MMLFSSVRLDCGKAAEGRYIGGVLDTSAPTVDWVRLLKIIRRNFNRFVLHD